MPQKATPVKNAAGQIALWIAVGLLALGSLLFPVRQAHAGITPTPTPLPTDTPVPTDTPAPTSTPKPEREQPGPAPAPTSAPTPTPTPTLLPAPQTLPETGRLPAASRFGPLALVATALALAGLTARGYAALRSSRANRR